LNPNAASVYIYRPGEFTMRLPFRFCLAALCCGINTGKVPGDTVAQVYIHQRSGSAARPVRELKGFRRVTLAPGERQTLRFPVGRDQLRFWSPVTRTWVVEPGVFDIWVGDDSTAKLHAELEVLSS
jgi:beta-glucosidase